MASTKIIIPSGTQYLSEVMKELPENVIFDKGRTGCGGTTIALEGDLNYIIAVPYISLAVNKAEQYKGRVLAFTGTTSEIELQSYLNTHAVIKIMVTYDSLERLIAITGTKGFRLLVDEYHILFTQYAFRTKGIQQVLSHYREFDSFTFMTATVLEEEFVLKELKGLDTIAAEWEDISEVEVQSVRCDKNIEYTLINTINKFRDGDAEGNAYIFVNSVTIIRQLIKKCGLTDDNTRAIWSASNDAETGLLRSGPSDPPKRINFITSTCFEGVDFYDPDGKTFIISDSNRSHTLLDISTSFQQIAGRIRNSKYNGRITHIYTTSRHNTELTFQDYKIHVEREVADTHTTIDILNTVPHKHRINIVCNTDYIIKEDGCFAFDSNLVCLDLYQFKLTKHLYKLRATLSEETKNYGFTVKEYTSQSGEDVISDVQIMDEDIMEKSFKEVVKTIQGSQNFSPKVSTRIFTAYSRYPFLEAAIAKLGFIEIERLKYNITNIRRVLISKSDLNKHNQIIKLLEREPKISTGAFAAAADLKRIFAKIYPLVELMMIGKASDIKNYYTVKETVIKINGKSVKGYVILSKKLI